MYIQYNKVGKWKNYPKAILRESYREDGVIKKRTIASLWHCSNEEIEAIALALKNKWNLSSLINVKEDLISKQWLSYWANWIIYKLIEKLWIKDALWSSENWKLSIWQIISRITNQWSRLSSVRQARDEVSDEIIHFDKDFNEYDLYRNLAWLSENQEIIENKLFKIKTKNNWSVPILFLYDVTSTYLEWNNNELAEYWYNRDKKSGKKQIVIWLLCDETWYPVSVEAFEWNTCDTATFHSQIDKIVKRFWCKNVTLVWDKWMIKSTQVNDILESNFNYITTINKPQIETLIKDWILQLSLFDTEIWEIKETTTDWIIRYIFRRNPIRAEEISKNRTEKEISIQKFIDKQNEYLKEHHKAWIETVINKINDKISKLKADKWLSAEVGNNSRFIILKINSKEKAELEKFDWCYCIKTNLSEDVASKDIVHNRYKDLAMVESAFRLSKTVHLELRPVYTINESTTRWHIFVVMLSYIIIKYLNELWNDIDLTVEEWIKRLRSLCTTVIQVKWIEFHQITKPNKQIQELFDKLEIWLPAIFPTRKINVDTKTKLKNGK